jgi:hypothetical protein
MTSSKLNRYYAMCIVQWPVTSLDPDDPTLMDHYPTYDTDSYLGDWPPTPTQQLHVQFKWKARVLISVKVNSLQKADGRTISITNSDVGENIHAYRNPCSDLSVYLHALKLQIYWQFKLPAIATT